MEESQKILTQKANAGRALVLSESAARRVKAGDLKTAIAELREAVSLDPESQGAYFLLASTLRQSSADPAEVIKTLRRVLELNSRHAPAHYQLGLVFESQGKMSEAIAEFRIAVGLSPSFIEARHAFGKVAMEIKDWETAVAQFRGVIAWEPKDAAAHHQLSLALKALGQVEEAEIELRAAQRLNRSLKTP
jgi:protein O-GlcNAc transferase